MKSSITQKHRFGCGAACIAFVLNITYQDSVGMLGIKKADYGGFYIKELSEALSKNGQPSTSNYLTPRLRSKIYQENVIVFIRRSKRYPAGHYLVRSNNRWMDPWINLVRDSDIENARSGFRGRLPGAPIYAIFPYI